MKDEILAPYGTDIAVVQRFSITGSFTDNGDGTATFTNALIELLNTVLQEATELEKSTLLSDSVANQLFDDPTGEETPNDALAQIIQLINSAGTMPVSGYYTGDGVTAGQFIDLGFEPSAVLIRGVRAYLGAEAWSYTNNAADWGTTSSWIVAGETGFYVKSMTLTGDYIEILNDLGITYGYTAFR